MTQWLPIESAPKGQRILGACPRRGIHIVLWEAERFSKRPRPYFAAEVPYRQSAIEDRADQPTHWCSLPTPPDGALAERLSA